MEQYDIRVNVWGDVSGPRYEWETVKAEGGDFVLYADAQATVEALQAQLREGEAAYHKVGEYNDHLKQQVEALQRERDEAIREHGKESGFWGRTCARLLDKRDKLQTALDAEREKVRTVEHELARIVKRNQGGYIGDRIAIDKCLTIIRTLDATTPAEAT